jgi:hypothetical protein
LLPKLPGQQALALTLHGEKPAKATDQTANALLLTKEKLRALRKKAADNDPDWVYFKARLDANLLLLQREAYQGSQLSWISDYALAYLVLKDHAPERASIYADKAIAFLKSALFDLQKSGSCTRQFLKRGDGHTRTFTLPHNDAIHSTLRVYLAPVTAVPVERELQGTTDSVGHYKKFLQVSDTADGTASYQEGKDWRHNPNLAENLIDWSPGGKSPAAGSLYHVTVTSAMDGKLVRHASDGRTRIRLATAPTASEAVFVEYVHGSPVVGSTSPAYQQTGAGDGGFNSILLDTTYPSRYLGKHTAMGIDWLDGYPGLTPALKGRALDLLVRWSDYIKDNGYYNNSPASNYGAGGYASRVMTALALAKRHPAGSRLVKEVLEYRQRHVLPLLNNETDSLKGGFWPEGWNYGALSAENIIVSGLALEAAGLIPEAKAERRWAGEVIEHLLCAQPAARLVYDGGDWFSYPARFPTKELFYVLAGASRDASLRSYASQVLLSSPRGHPNNYLQFLFHQSVTSPSDWSSLPLQHYARGTGLLVARSDWGEAPTWMAFQAGNLLGADHQSCTPGQLQIRRGSDDLLINGCAPGALQIPQKSPFGNVMVVDDNGERKQVYQFCMGLWYGKPGVVTLGYEAGKEFVYRGVDYRAAYSSKRRPGDGGSVSELTRQVVYFRPARLIVYDRVTTLKAKYPRQLRWHFLREPQREGTAFTAASGQSKLFGQTFSTAPLEAEGKTVEVGRAAQVGQLIIQDASTAKSTRYVTVLQTAPATQERMAPAERIASADLHMEGARIGECLALFAREGHARAPAAFSYRVESKAPLRHLLADLRPGKGYQVKVDGRAQTAVATASGTLSFATAAAARAIEVRLLP